MSEITIPVVDGKVIITSGFRVPERPNHHGVDFAPRPRGKPPILSFKNGTIILLQKNNPSAGNWLEIEHDDGIVSTYMHLDSISPMLAVRNKVSKGQQIGIMGTTGQSTGVHLHFEIRRTRNRDGGRNAVDPMPFLIENAATSQPKAPAFPVSEENLQAMVSLGVINTPDHWRKQNIEGLNQLLSEAARDKKLDKRIDNGISDADTAFAVLADAGIISAADHWKGLLKSADVSPWLGKLLVNIANRSLDPLHRIVWAEARGEDMKGQILVANVVMNRHKAAGFPDGIYNVIHQPGQFEPIRNGAYDRATPTPDNIMAVTHSLMIDHSRGALFFDSAPNSWARQNRQHLFDHGGHSFFA